MERVLSVGRLLSVGAMLGAAVSAGCQAKKDYVTRDEMIRMISRTSDDLVNEALESEARNREERERRIEELSQRALTAAKVGERAAAVLASSDEAAGELLKTLMGVRKAIDVVATNLANLETTGYKRMDVAFAGGEEGRPLLMRDFGQGDFERTGWALDLAIRGQGFFMVTIQGDAGGGVGYTREGRFVVNAEGQVYLRGPDGHALTPRVTVPREYTGVEVSPQGQVYATVPGSEAAMNVGVIQLATFTNPQGLKHVEGGVFVRTEKSGDPRVSTPGSEGAGTLVSGSLERSNVDMVVELVRLRVLQNWYEGVAGALVRVLEMTEGRSGVEGKARKQLSGAE